MKISNCLMALATTGLALGTMLPAAGAKSVDKKSAWGAATIAAGVGAVVEASKDHPLNAAVLAAGAAYSYSQYDKARKDEKYDRYGDRNYRDNRDYRDNRGDRDDPYSDSGYNDNGRNVDYNSDDPYGYGSYGRNRPSARYGNNTREVSGVITGTAGNYNRKINVRLDNGDERSFDVEKNAPVRRFGDAISVHELRKGEAVLIRIDRYRSSGTLSARRVDVVDTWGNRDRYNGNNRNNRDDRYNSDNPFSRPGASDYNNGYSNNGYSDYDTRIEGRVSSIDSRSGILRVDTGSRVLTVNTDRAEIRDTRDGNRSIRLRDLWNDARVTVEGRRSGDRIDATRVTVR